MRLYHSVLARLPLHPLFYHLSSFVRCTATTRSAESLKLRKSFFYDVDLRRPPRPAGRPTGRLGFLHATSKRKETRLFDPITNLIRLERIRMEYLPTQASFFFAFPARSGETMQNSKLHEAHISCESLHHPHEL